MSARHTPALTSGRPHDAASARAAIRYPSIAAVLAELDPPLGTRRADWPEPSVVVSRSQVLASYGLPAAIPYDDQRHLAQLAARDRDVTRGREIACAVVLIAALVWFFLIGGPDILLP